MPKYATLRLMYDRNKVRSNYKLNIIKIEVKGQKPKPPKLRP